MGRSFVMVWRPRERLSAARRGVHSNGYSCQENDLVVVVRQFLQPARHLQANACWLGPLAGAAVPVRPHDRGSPGKRPSRAARNREFAETAEVGGETVMADAEPQFEDEPEIDTYAIAVE